MKKYICCMAAAAIMAVGSVASAQIIGDMEAGTSGSLPASNWLPGFSGTSSGFDTTTDTAVFSNEQANGGAQSLRIDWAWTGGTGVIRIQPAAAGWTAVGPGNAGGDKTAVPFGGFAIHTAGSGDRLQYYLGRGAASGSPYAALVGEYTLSWSGWRIVDQNMGTAPVVEWVTTGGTPVVMTDVCISGFFWRQQGAAAGSSHVYYLDDIGYTASARATVAPDAAVGDWTIF